MCVNQAGRRGKTNGLSCEVSQRSDSRVTTNCEKSAEAIVVMMDGESRTERRAEQLKTSIKMYVPIMKPDRYEIET